MIRLCAALLAALFCCTPATAQSAHELLAGESVGINPRYLLQHPNGRSITNEDFRGRFQLIAFGYTYCPDVCPTTLVEMATILKQLGDRAARLQAIFITVDPERDTAAVLKTYTEFFDTRILGLTGSPALLRRRQLQGVLRQGPRARYRQLRGRPFRRHDPARPGRRIRQEIRLRHAGGRDHCANCANTGNPAGWSGSPLTAN